MNSNAFLSFSRYASADDCGLTLDDLQERVPAIFASGPHDRLSEKYTFVPTARVLHGLISAGFVAVDARQASTRSSSPVHARHIIRLRRRFETVALRDAVPEIVFLNSHDGTSAYQLRLGIYRAMCTNGLIVSSGAFPALCVAHRGDIVDAIVAGALEASERFDALAARVEVMEARVLLPDEQLQLAAQALEIRYPANSAGGIVPSTLLRCRRTNDSRADLWTVFNRVQENLLSGGLVCRAASGRLSRTRRLTSIRENVRANCRLWNLAESVLAS
jgi:hypothetical protein